MASGRKRVRSSSLNSLAATEAEVTQKRGRKRGISAPLPPSQSPPSTPSPSLGSGRYTGNIRVWIAPGVKGTDKHHLDSLTEAEKLKLTTASNWTGKSGFGENFVVFGTHAYPVRMFATLVSSTLEYADVVVWGIYVHDHDAYQHKLGCFRGKEKQEFSRWMTYCLQAWKDDVPMRLATCDSTEKHAPVFQIKSRVRVEEQGSGNVVQAQRREKEKGKRKGKFGGCGRVGAESGLRVISCTA